MKLSKQNKKYELTGKTINHYSRTLHQIRRISDGLVGGYIEKESNLSYEGNCFVFGNAKVYGDALVLDNAKVFGNAWVYDNARVLGNAEVFGNAEVSGNARVYGDAKVFDNALVLGNALVLDNARVYGDALVLDNALVCGNARVWDNARVSGGARVSVDNITKPTDIITFNFGKHKCTATPNHVRIGCKVKTYEEWEKITTSQAMKEFGLDRVDVKSYKQFINICKLRFNK